MVYLNVHNMSRWKWTSILAAWGGAQAIWLQFAYKLEFLGESTHSYIWAASIVFLLVNVWISSVLIRHRNVPEIIHAAPGIITVNNAVL